MMNFDFKGKTVLVTGYFSDIGYEISNMYLRFGARVISTYNKSYHKDKIKEGIYLFKLDLGDINSLKGFINLLKANNMNNIDILVNNVGVCNINPLIFQEDEEIISLININLTNTILLTKYILRDFMDDGGKIINISSVWGRVGASCEVVYSSSKGGLDLFTKSLAREMESRDIKVIGISPGFINTKMNDIISKDELKNIIEEIPLKRIGEVSDISNIIKFLSSNYSNISGEIINIDGGWIL